MELQECKGGGPRDVWADTFQTAINGIPRTLCTGRLAFRGHGAAFNGDASRWGEWAIERGAMWEDV
jgi:hypothetical protein